MLLLKFPQGLPRVQLFGCYIAIRGGGREWGEGVLQLRGARLARLQLAKVPGLRDVVPGVARGPGGVKLWAPPHTPRLTAPRL